MRDDSDVVREGGADAGNTGDAATLKLARNRPGSNFWRQSETSLRWSNAAKKRVKSKLVEEIGVEGTLSPPSLPWLSVLHARWSCGLATGKSRKFCPRHGLFYNS